ncbi:phosphatase PAP2 family protein [Kitasatospora albolonga]|uniref:phosphatase PAP2 family protein n=1 Tax=Kitasatospora albolonga TaxID=68173 RepID=UPI0035F0ACD2
MTARAARLRRWAPALLALTLFAALTTVLAARGFAPLPGEAELHRWAVGHRPGWSVHLAVAVTFLGTGVPPYLAAAAAGLLLSRHRPDTADTRARLVTALAPVLVLAGGQLVRHGLMWLFARPRPPVADWVAAHPSGYAYPSGHAFTSAVAAGLLAWALLTTVRAGRGVPLAAAVIGTAAGVGLTRIHLGVHWPADVLGGWLLAAFWLALLLPSLRPGASIAPPAPAVAPEAAPPPGTRLRQRSTVM